MHRLWLKIQSEPLHCHWLLLLIFQCNGKDVLIPMVIEEPSVVAAVSNMAQLTRKSGGFLAESDKSIMIGQIQIPNVIDYSKTISILEANKPIYYAGQIESIPN